MKKGKLLLSVANRYIITEIDNDGTLYIYKGIPEDGEI